MSIPKSVALLGIGRDNLRLIPTDTCLPNDSRRTRSSNPRGQIAGRIAIAVVASAGTVNTGAIDPFPQIAAVARRHGAWFHIDGAYGALAAMAERRRFDGLELADSISWTRTSGFINLWTAAACCIARLRRLSIPSRTAATTRVRSAPTRSKDLCSSRSPWSCPEDFAP